MRCTSGRAAATCASPCPMTSALSPSPCSCPARAIRASPRCPTCAAARALFERDFADALPLIPDFDADCDQQSDRQPGHAVPRPLASGRPRRADRRCRARDGAVPRPGHELRVRGLRRAGRANRRRPRDWRAGLRRLRGRAPAQCAGHPGRWRWRTTSRCATRSTTPTSCCSAQLERLLAERHPGRFVPRYAMVSFLRVPYATALRARQGSSAQMLVEGLRPRSLTTTRIDAGRRWRRADARCVAGERADACWQQD